MDQENTLRMLFPQVDARLIKATVLDGDDINSALDFLIREGMHSDELKPDKTSDLATTTVHVDGTHNAKQHLVTLSQVELCSDDFSYDKHEESIVWKGGLVSRGLEDQKSVYGNEGQRVDDFYESGHQREETNMRGNERIDWWAATWPKAIELKEHDVLDSSSSVQEDSEVQEEAGSPLWSDTELYKAIQQRANWQRPIADTDATSTGSTRSSLLDKERGSSWGNLGGLNTFQKGSSTEHVLQLSQDSFEVFSPMALDANMLERGRAVSSSDNRLTKDDAKDDDSKLSSCISANTKRDCLVPVRESLLESPRYAIDTEDLDKLVIEAKCHKDNMRKGMEDILLLRKKAEQEELVAQQAKSEAARGGADILLKVKDLQQQMLHKRMEYDMRAAEVYGERSVLSIEARELRSRLLETQAEQARALSLLDSVRCTLAARLEKSSQEKHFAFEEAKLREESAKELLAREEDSAQTLVENFKALEMEAETCRKLREFLIERGNAVDSLQGEMAVLCEDVLNFKKQVDENIPLTASRSLSWSHMSHVTEQFVCTTPSSDVKDCSSSRSIALKCSDLLKSSSDISFLTLSSATSGLPTSVGHIECALRSQYFSPNTHPIETSDVCDKKGVDVQEAVDQGLVTTACMSCDNGQTQKEKEEF